MRTIYVVFGRTGSGKSYICNKILSGKYTPDPLKKLVWVTTRPKRNNDPSDSEGWYEFIEPMNTVAWGKAPYLAKRSYVVNSGNTYRYAHKIVDNPQIAFNEADYITPQCDSIYGLALLDKQYSQYGVRIVLVYVATDIPTILSRIRSRADSDEDVREANRRLVADEPKYSKIDMCMRVKETGLVKMPKISDMVSESEWNREKEQFFYDNKLDWEEWKDRRFLSLTVYNDDADSANVSLA